MILKKKSVYNIYIRVHFLASNGSIDFFNLQYQRSVIFKSEGYFLDIKAQMTRSDEFTAEQC